MLEGMIQILGWIHWDPSSEFVVLPILGLPVTWYGVLFASGFWVGFHIFAYMYQRFLSGFPKFREGDVNWKQWILTMPSDLQSLKEGSLDSCNELLKKDLINKELSRSDKRVLRCAERRWGEKVLIKLTRRLRLERKYPEIFYPLKQRSKDYSEKLILYVILAAVIGSRIAFILFYQNPIDYLMNPVSILKTWEGGLASHGGIGALILTLFIFHRKAKGRLKAFTFWDLLDHIAVPTMLVASMIRIGNFFNQEILGVATDKPWGVVFAHPKDGSLPVPRHPAQLYESIFYLSLFFLLIYLWSTYGKKFSAGRLAGIALGGAFLFRFFIEFVKTHQSGWFDEQASNILMGQLLSVPMIIVGLFFVFRKSIAASPEHVE